VLLLVIVSLLAPLAGCTKEKAEAVKNAAEQFRLESKTALAQISTLARQDVALPTMTSEEEVKRLVATVSTVATPADLASFVDNKTDVKRRFDAMTASVDQDLRDMEEVYDLFASMYRSLPKGHFFAKDAVKQSKVYAIKLTMKMVQYARDISENPYQLRARHVLLIEKYAAAQKLTDPQARNAALILASQELLQLRDEELKANQAAIAQCLKAAETGKAIIDLIDRYGTLTVADVLDLTRNTLAIVNDISGGSPQIKSMIDRYDNFVKNKINTDPLWKAVKDNDVSSLTKLIKTGQ
jgi:hypothetical protein